MSSIETPTVNSKNNGYVIEDEDSCIIKINLNDYKGEGSEVVNIKNSPFESEEYDPRVTLNEQSKIFNNLVEQPQNQPTKKELVNVGIQTDRVKSKSC
jgi:hypothetical protein